MEIKYTITYTRNLFVKIMRASFRANFLNLQTLFILLLFAYSIYDAMVNESRYLGFYIGIYSLGIIYIGVIIVKGLVDSEKPGTWEYTLNDDGILAIKPTREEIINWDTVKDIDHMKGYWLLKFETGPILPIPEDVLSPEKKAWIKGKAGVKRGRRKRSFFWGA